MKYFNWFFLVSCDEIRNLGRVQLFGKSVKVTASSEFSSPRELQWKVQESLAHKSYIWSSFTPALLFLHYAHNSNLLPQAKTEAAGTLWNLDTTLMNARGLLPYLLVMSNHNVRPSLRRGEVEFTSWCALGRKEIDTMRLWLIGFETGSYVVQTDFELFFPLSSTSKVLGC